jgi:hypothetical protein
LLKNKIIKMSVLQNFTQYQLSNPNADLEADMIYKTLVIMSEDDKPSLVEMLKKSGSLETELSTQKELLDASFKALMLSDRFRNELRKYLAQQIMQSDMSSFVGDDAYANQGGYKEKMGYTRVGGFLRNTFSSDNINKFLDVGLAFASAKLQDSASRKGNQQAIDFELAKAKSTDAESLRLQAEAMARSTTAPSSKKWVLPVAIGGGVLVLGVIIYLVMRKK